MGQISSCECCEEGRGRSERAAPSANGGAGQNGSLAEDQIAPDGKGVRIGGVVVNGAGKELVEKLGGNMIRQKLNASGGGPAKEAVRQFLCKCYVRLDGRVLCFKCFMLISLHGRPSGCSVENLDAQTTSDSAKLAIKGADGELKEKFKTVRQGSLGNGESN